MEHCFSQRGSMVFGCDISAESGVGDFCWRPGRLLFCVAVDGVACCVNVVMGGRGVRACVGLKRACFEPPPLLIADTVVVQAVMLAIVWTFSMRAVADGALLLSAWLERLWLRHRCRIRGWRYSQAVRWICNFYFMVDGVACCVNVVMGGRWWEHVLG